MGRPGRDLLAALVGGGVAMLAVPAAACAPGPVGSDALAGLGDRGEILLASGRRALLGSLHWPEEPEAEAARAWLRAWQGRPLAVMARGEPDRWGRLRVDAASEEAAVDLAGGLVAEGLARVDAGEEDDLCRPGLLRVEAGARAARRGVWRTAPLAAEDGAALRAGAGRFAVVEGRIRHVGVRPARTYLDFAPRGGDGLTVTVQKRTWRRMLEHGFSASGLTGRRVRVRGVVEIRRGPEIALTAPGLVELLDEADPGAGTWPGAGSGTDGGRAPRR